MLDEQISGENEPAIPVQAGTELKKTKLQIRKLHISCQVLAFLLKRNI
jgi:hypothetical protein